MAIDCDRAGRAACILLQLWACQIFLYPATGALSEIENSVDLDFRPPIEGLIGLEHKYVNLQKPTYKQGKQR